jgi:hypothetical protein
MLKFLSTLPIRYTKQRSPIQAVDWHSYRMSYLDARKGLDRDSVRRDYPCRRMKTHGGVMTPL